MKVSELKVVVDANAEEMRQGFARVDGEIADVRKEMRDGFERLERRMDEQVARLERRMDDQAARLERRMDEKAEETKHYFKVVIEDLMDKVVLVAEATVDRKLRGR